jgi:hypothetical protein
VRRASLAATRGRPRHTKLSTSSRPVTGEGTHEESQGPDLVRPGRSPLSFHSFFRVSHSHSLPVTLPSLLPAFRDGFLSLSPLSISLRALAAWVPRRPRLTPFVLCRRRTRRRRRGQPRPAGLLNTLAPLCAERGRKEGRSLALPIVTHTAFLSILLPMHISHLVLQLLLLSATEAGPLKRGELQHER